MPNTKKELEQTREPRSKLDEDCAVCCGSNGEKHPRAVHVGRQCLRYGCKCPGFVPVKKAKIP